MSLYDKMLCTGQTGCGHPRHEHTGTHLRGSKTACRHPLGQGRAKCACTGFKEGSSPSSHSGKTLEASGG